jgi:hypothetical protein
MTVVYFKGRLGKMNDVQIRSLHTYNIRITTERTVVITYVSSNTTPVFLKKLTDNEIRLLCSQKVHFYVHKSQRVRRLV